MNKVRLSCSCIALILSTLSSPALAQDQQQQLVGSILKQIDLKSGFSTPDELNEALEPYSNCLITESGAELRDAAGNRVRTGDPPRGCTQLRAEAVTRANEKLTQLGIQSSKDRMFIIDMSLGAIEVTADANRKWLEVQRTAKSQPTCEEQVELRDKAFAPLKAEMDALFAEDRTLDGGKDGYPPLGLTQRYLALQEKMEAFSTTHPAPACDSGRQITNPLPEKTNASH